MSAVKKLSGRKAINSLRKMGTIRKKKLIFISDHIAIEPKEYPAVKKVLGEKVCKDNKKRHGKKLVNPLTGRMIQRTKANKLCRGKTSQRIASLEREIERMKNLLNVEKKVNEDVKQDVNEVVNEVVNEDIIGEADGTPSAHIANETDREEPATEVVNEVNEDIAKEEESKENDNGMQTEPTFDSRSIMTLEMDDMIQNMDDILGNIQSDIRK